MLAKELPACSVGSSAYDRMSDDMDVNAGKILRLEASVDEVGKEIYGKVLEVASGMQSCSESLGHQEFVLTYKSFEPIGRPACQCKVILDACSLAI